MYPKSNVGRIFGYFQLYIFNSIIISLILVTTFISNSYRIFSFTNTYESITYGIYVFTPILTVLYFYGNLLDILIIIERTEKYLPAKYRYSKRLEFNKICLTSFIFSILLNFPTFFNWKRKTIGFLKISYLLLGYFRIFVQPLWKSHYFHHFFH